MLLQIDIVTPERQIYSGEAEAITAPGWEGEFEVLPGHDLFLSLLRGGILSFTDEQGLQRYIVGRGFAEASASQVTILTDSCETTEGIDKDQAEKDRVESEQTLFGCSEGSAEWAQAEEKRELWRLSGRIVRTSNVTQTAVGDKNGLWPTVIAAAVICG